jgi:hypothetical protein
MTLQVVPLREGHLEDAAALASAPSTLSP